MLGNPWARAGWPQDRWPRPWMVDNGPVMSGDGAPSFAMLKAKEGDLKDLTFTVFSGGFHFMLEAHKMRGRMFALGHMNQIWKHWRPTDKQLAWVFIPGDPNQVDAELIMYYYALIASVIFACLDDKKASGDVTGISAVEAYEFLLDTARETPIYAQILSEMRTAEAIFLLHMAEEERNADYFVCALKFLAPLFTANHATKYTWILAKFFQWWHCASGADKAIFQECIMCKQTENGRYIFVDRFVE